MHQGCPKLIKNTLLLCVVGVLPTVSSLVAGSLSFPLPLSGIVLEGMISQGATRHNYFNTREIVLEYFSRRRNSLDPDHKHSTFTQGTPWLINHRFIPRRPAHHFTTVSETEKC
jgi:hypothetical protein